MDDADARRGDPGGEYGAGIVWDRRTYRNPMHRDGDVVSVPSRHTITDVARGGSGG